VRVARGDAAGALDAYTRSLDLRERLAGTEPDNTGYQRDPAVGAPNVASPASRSVMRQRTISDGAPVLLDSGRVHPAGRAEPAAGRTCTWTAIPQS
jgi:hypothetical protein